MLRSLLLAFALTIGTAPAFAAAQDEDEAAEHAGGEGGHEHEHSLRGMFSNQSFLAALINFSLLVWVLRKLGKQPLADFLSSRRSEMEKNMAAAADMKAKAEAVFKEYNARLAQLDTELAKLRGDIERAAEEDKQRIVADAEENARRMKRETEALIDQYGKTLSAQVRSEMVEAAVAAAEKLLRENISESDQQRIAQSYDQHIKDSTRDAPALRSGASVRMEKSS
jgi:F-type H+-transporting ATPase subunit b